MSIGQQLKEAREKLGFDERSASDRTHIRRHYIIAMENDDFDSIDLAPVYRIGFLRIYAKLLKLNADAIVSEFKETQNAKASGTRGIFRPAPIKTISTELPDADEGFPPNGPTAIRTPRKFAIAIAAVAVLLIAGAAIVTLKTCTPGNVANDTASVSTANTSNAPAYEIEITTNQSQKVTIYEQYKDWDRVSNKPIAGAIILDEFVPAGRPKKITARGTIYIREEVLGGCQIKYPAKEAFVNAEGTTLIPIGANARQMSGKNNTAWLIYPNA